MGTLDLATVAAVIIGHAPRLLAKLLRQWGREGEEWRAALSVPLLDAHEKPTSSDRFELLRIVARGRCDGPSEGQP